MTRCVSFEVRLFATGLLAKGASFLPLRLIEQTGKPIHCASVGFQPAGQHLSATKAKSSQSDRSPSDSRLFDLISRTALAAVV